MKAPRVGIGYDFHRLVDGRLLILGGVDLSFTKGLDGHSDADVLVHAVIDALLGAVSAGDIGRMFPDWDETYRGVSSIDLLQRAMDEVREHGYTIGNVDAVVVAEEPKLAPHVTEIQQSLANALAVEEHCVSVKGKTNERCGAVGRGEGIAAHAVVMLLPS